MGGGDKTLTVTVLGCGFMGTAILEGLLRKQDSEQPQVKAIACVRSDASLKRVQTALSSCKDRVEAIQEQFTDASSRADIVLIGVPPDQYKPLFKTSGLLEALKGKVIISMLAGVSCEQLLQELSGESKSDSREQYHLLRIIPTIAANAGDSVTLVADTPCAGKQQREQGEWLIRQIGSIQPTPERLMDTATAVNAACNALAIVAIEAVVDGSVAEGLPRESALALAAQSLRSAAGLACAGMSPETIKAAMSIPQGITINSLLDLERARVRAGISDTVRQAIVYTKNMSS